MPTDKRTKQLNVRVTKDHNGLGLVVSPNNTILQVPFAETVPALLKCEKHGPLAARWKRARWLQKSAACVRET